MESRDRIFRTEDGDDHFGKDRMDRAIAPGGTTREGRVLSAISANRLNAELVLPVPLAADRKLHVARGKAKQRTVDHYLGLHGGVVAVGELVPVPDARQHGGIRG